jgi:hypothetical protein
MLVRPSVRWLVGWLIGWSVCPYITLSAFFSAVCGQIDLKFSRDLHIDLLFQFNFLFFLDSSSNSSFSSFFSSEIDFVYIFIAYSEMDAFYLLTHRDIWWSNLET